MVERIEHIKKVDPWTVTATQETKHGFSQGSDESHEQNARDSFGESSDFVQLLMKDPKKYKGEKIPSAQIRHFTFRSVSTHREKAFLEVDISLFDGSLIRGAQIAVSRQEGMHYLGQQQGEEIIVDKIVKGTFLTVALPQPHKATAPASSLQTASRPVATSFPALLTELRWFHYVAFSAFALIVTCLIYVLTF